MRPIQTLQRNGENYRRSQRGVALIVALILLVIISLLGLSSMRNTGLQERMTANLFSRSVEFQEVETAARDAQALLPPVGAPTFTAACTSGLCTTPTATVTPRWLDTTFSNWTAGSTSISALVSAKAKYFVEDMGTAESWAGCSQEDPIDARCLTPRYRISACSNGSTDNKCVGTSYDHVTLIQGSYRP
jgi:type IV pilus assembly protein PilX